MVSITRCDQARLPTISTPKSTSATSEPRRMAGERSTPPDVGGTLVS
ncbi:MAG: hypothetical protein KDK70_12810 [Myxococcales bacterium]|nr:hypothetical protein [Myxococcales bacterium]